MTNKVTINLRPILSRTNLPTVIKTAILPNDWQESIFIATQPGEIFYLRNGTVGVFLDIRNNILKLGASGNGYDERGLLGLAFHPQFSTNGLFYLHYSLADSQGPGALTSGFRPNPCSMESLSLRWEDRETKYDHIDTVEEWVFYGIQPVKVRTLLNLRRPFANHNGVNSLSFSPESGRLVLTTGDGGLGYDPFNLSQNDIEVAGKIIELDVSMNAFTDEPVVSRFDELPVQTQAALTVMAKGVRNIPGITYQQINNSYVKYVGNVGQDLVESVFWFSGYRPIPVNELVQAYSMNQRFIYDDIINLGWRGWEGALPTSNISPCSGDPNLRELTIAYYDEAIINTAKKLTPLTCYYHYDPRPDKFSGTALTGVQAYMGNEIPALRGTVVFTDFVRKGFQPARGVLAYTALNPYCMISDYNIIETTYDFGSQAAFYTCLGSSRDQSKLYLGTYGSMRVTDLNLGTIFEISP